MSLKAWRSDVNGAGFKAKTMKEARLLAFEILCYQHRARYGMFFGTKDGAAMWVATDERVDIGVHPSGRKAFAGELTLNFCGGAKDEEGCPRITTISHRAVADLARRWLRVFGDQNAPEWVVKAMGGAK